LFKGIEELSKRLGLGLAEKITKLLQGFDAIDLKFLLNALRKLPGLEDFVQHDSTITLRRWRDIIQLRDPSSMDSISNITSTLAPMQLKVRKMLGWLLNKSEGGNMYGPACEIFEGKVGSFETRLKIYLDDIKRGKDSELERMRSRRAQDDLASRLAEERRR